MDVSIIIVSYNTKKLLENCLVSVYKNTAGIDFEVIVSDNGSTDGSVEMLREKFPRVLLVENGENLGFGAANNRALPFAKGKYILYLNSDTILLNNSVRFFFDYWENNGEKENLGALGCLLQDEEQLPTFSSGSFAWFDENTLRFCIDKIRLLLSVYLKTARHFLFGYKLKTVRQSKSSHESESGFVDWIIGADLFLKNNNLARFDENIFMYCEEIDLQYQLKKQGLKRKLIDTPKIIHLEKGSSSQTATEVLDLASFSKINDSLSRIYLLKKNKFSFPKILVFQLTTLLIWLNPLLIRKTSRHIKKLFKQRITRIPEYPS